jgi:aldose 1-epimerase
LPHPGVHRRPFGTTPSGELVFSYDVTNGRGSRLSVITLGATITALRVADRDGSLDDVVLGLDDVEGYLTRSPYFGTVAGRYANRIARGRFTLDGVEYVLAANNPPNHLHGGAVGFDKHLYAARAVTCSAGRGVRLSRTSPDGEEGYPGELRFAVRYLLDDDNRLIIDYQATSTKATPFNPSQHSYFNLSGAKRGDVLGHELVIHADRYTPVDATLIPTGELAPVDGTPFDFRSPTPIGARIGDSHPQLTIAGGYDHNYVLHPPTRRGALVHAARVHDPLTGRTLDVHTTEPGMQLYTGNFLDGSIMGSGGCHYVRNAGFCLETQHFPDSPNQPRFPSTILRPGTTFHSRTIYQFGTARPEPT